MSGRARIAAAAAAAAALLVAPAARAEAGEAAAAAGAEAAEAAEDLPWFAGMLVGAHALRGRTDFETLDEDHGMLVTVEGGKLLTPWLAAAISFRFTTRADQFHADATHDPVLFLAGHSRELGLGPRLYLLPKRGRIRIGLGVTKLVARRGENPDLTGDPDFVVWSTMTGSELHIGGVPYRRGALDLEIGATLTVANLPEEHRLTWYSLGIGLRWRSPAPAPAELPPRPSPPSSPPPPSSRWSLALSSGLVGMWAGAVDSRFAVLGLAAHRRLRPGWELELGMHYGWETMAPEDGDELATAQLAAAARYVYRDEPPMRWFLVGRLGVASAGFQPPAPALVDLRPLVGVGIGFERRVRALALQAELGASLLAPRLSTAEDFEGLAGPTHEVLRNASWLWLGSFSLGLGYYF